MFLVDLSTASLSDGELCVEVIQRCWLSCFSDSLKHTPELLLQMRLDFMLALNSSRSLMKKTTDSSVEGEYHQWEQVNISC